MVIFWHTPSERVFMDVKNLPKPPEGMQYQLWALKDDQTMDMGLIDLEKDAAEMREMGAVENADSFAITLEPKGGSKQPDMERMYVHGGPVNI